MVRCYHKISEVLLIKLPASLFPASAQSQMSCKSELNMAAGQKRVWRRNRERDPDFPRAFVTAALWDPAVRQRGAFNAQTFASVLTWILLGWSCLKSPSILLKVCIIFIIISWPALINEGANGPKIIISLMFHIIQETQPPARTAIMPEESENCAQELWHFEFSFQKKNLVKSFEKIIASLCTNLSIFWTNSFRFSSMLLREMFGRRRDRLQMMGSSGGDRGRKSRRFLTKLQITNCKPQIVNYKLQIQSANWKLQMTNLQMMGSSGGDRGRKSRRFLTNSKLQIANYKL